MVLKSRGEIIRGDALFGGNTVHYPRMLFYMHYLPGPKNTMCEVYALIGAMIQQYYSVQYHTCYAVFCLITAHLELLYSNYKMSTVFVFLCDACRNYGAPLL